MARRLRGTMAFLGTLLFVVVASYAFVVLFSSCQADGMIFQPRPSSYRAGERLIKIPAGDGTGLSAVHLVAPEAEFTVFYLHGNAEDLGDVLPHLEQIHSRGLSVVCFDYRGYGTTPGTANEANVLADAGAVFRHLTNNLGVPPSRVIVYGRSVGSGPAVDLASREPVGGLVLDGAFTSAFRVVTRYPMLPGDRFRNLAKMPQVCCPVLVIHGRLDGTVPFSHALQLFAAAGEPKRNLWVDGAGHNDLVEVAGEAYWQALTDFAASLRR